MAMTISFADVARLRKEYEISVADAKSIVIRRALLDAVAEARTNRDPDLLADIVEYMIDKQFPEQHLYRSSGHD